MKFVGIVKKLTDRVLRRVLSPIKYAKRIGVSIADNVRLVGTTQWGTEPWLITIGKDTTLSNNVKFTNHDGGG